MILVHSGNRVDAPDRLVARLAPERVDAVTTTIERLLRDLRPSCAVSAPANGADLIFLDAARRIGLAIRVVLPLSVETFIDRSVVAPDGQWSERFRRVLDYAERQPGSTIERHDLDPDDEWFLHANELLLRAARDAAADGEAIVALTVRPTGGEAVASATDDFAARARSAGLTVLNVDPRPSAPADVEVR